MELEKLEVYQISLKLSEEIWGIYSKLPADLKFNIGSQVLRSIDSIGANVAEGFGRYHYKDGINVRGSLWESKHWIYLLNKRKLIENEKYDKITNDMEVLGKKLNGFIKSIKEKSRDK